MIEVISFDIVLSYIEAIFGFDLF